MILVASLAIIVLSGCGDSGSSGSDEVTVETGSLTKAEFIDRADAVCEAVRSQFTQQYATFARDRSQAASEGSEGQYLQEVLDELIVPSYEEQMIEKISALGAPNSEVAGTEAFLNALQQRIDELQAEPSELMKSPYPFEKVAAVAKSQGLNGCAESFS